MSIKLLLLTYGIDNKHISSSEKNVLSRLSVCADDNGQNIYPSYTRLAKDIGLGRSTIINAVNSLTKKGFITKEKQKKGNEYDRNNYVINIEKIKALQRGSSETDSLLSKVVQSPYHPSPAIGLGVVQQLHHPSPMATPNSKVKGKKKVNTHSKGDFAASVDGVCVSSLSHDELQQGENDQKIGQTQKGLSSASQLACPDHNADQPINGFEELTCLWIKKEGFFPAQKIYKTIVPRKISAKKILESAKQKMISLQKNYPDEDDRIRYCPKLDKWLQNEGYNDDPYVPESLVSPSKMSPQEIKKEEAWKKAEENMKQVMKKYQSHQISGENQP